MTPTRLLFCIGGIGRGGAEMQLVGLIGHLDRRRFAPHLCTLHPSDTLLAEVDCPRLELPTRRLVSPTGGRHLYRLAGYLRREGIQVVQTFFQDPTLLGLGAARLARVPVRVVSFRDMGFWRNPAQEFRMRCVYPLATGFLANSLAVRDAVCTRDRIDRARVKVIYNGIDSARLLLVEHTETELAVGMVGNLYMRIKRTDLFLRAAARVARQHPEVTWHVIGDGALRGEYEALATDLGIRQRCVFTGGVSDVAGYLGKLAIGVNCSDSEGFSNAVLEYMLAGCAVVATAVGGNPEVVRDGETGLLVPPDNEEALASALSRLIDDRATRLRLSRQARAMVEHDYSWEKCVAEHEEFYRTSLLTAARHA